MLSGPSAHIQRIAIGVLVLGVIGFFGRRLFIPETFGVYGHYRAAAIEEEAARPIRHMTNAPCFPCHEYEANLHLTGCTGPFPVSFVMDPWRTMWRAIEKQRPCR